MLNQSTKGIDQNLELELQPLFYPESIAVIGASQDLRKPNGIPLALLYMFGYKGAVYPVNPKYQTVSGLKCYPSLYEVPGPVDLAIVGVAAAQVMEVLNDCAARGVKAVVIFTSGFAEIGPQGEKVQLEIAELAARSGMRILGPNCLGIINYYNGNMASFFFHERPARLAYPGLLSFITQSGGLGGVIYRMTLQFSVGFNYFVSTGNEADITFSQVLDYLVGKDEVTIIGGYMEGLKKSDGRLFMQACRKALERKKLVTLLKVGRTASGAAAAASHTGALVGEDRTYDGVFRQLGVLRADDVEQMNAMITLYAAGRLPAGKRMAIVTVSGGGGVLIADKCPRYGLEVISLTAETQAQLEQFFPSYASTRNPVDLTSRLMVEPALFQKTIRTVMEDPLVDLGSFFYSLDMPVPEATRKIIEVYREIKKPLIIFTWPSGTQHAEAAKRELVEAGIPVIENIAAGLWAAASLAGWAGRAGRMLAAPDLKPGFEREEALAIIDRAGGLSPALNESFSKKLLKAYGIPAVREIEAGNSDEAVRAAQTLGYPVVLKIESPDILHKTEVGGVKLNLTSDFEVRQAFEEIVSRARAFHPSARIDGVLVQEMLNPGLEMIIGIKRDPVFGPVVLVGLGGVLVELLDDVAVRAAPLSEQDAREMLAEIKGSVLLDGVRGQQPRDREALVDILMKVSRLAAELPGQVAELDINPLIVYEKGAGAVAADALVILNK